MNRASKEASVASLSERIAEAPLVVLADYRGTSVADISAFRNKLRDGGVFYGVFKNTLGRRAIEGTDKEGLDDHLGGMTGWVVSGEDGVAAAKLLRDSLKQLKTIEIKGGYFDGEVLDAASIQKVADLPSKEQLQAQLLATVLEAPRKVLRVLQAPGRDLMYLLQNYANKIEDGE